MQWISTSTFTCTSHTRTTATEYIAQLVYCARGHLYTKAGCQCVDMCTPRNAHGLDHYETVLLYWYGLTHSSFTWPYLIHSLLRLYLGTVIHQEDIHLIHATRSFMYHSGFAWFLASSRLQQSFNQNSLKSFYLSEKVQVQYHFKEAFQIGSNAYVPVSSDLFISLPWLVESPPYLLIAGDYNWLPPFTCNVLLSQTRVFQYILRSQSNWFITLF